MSKYDIDRNKENAKKCLCLKDRVTVSLSYPDFEQPGIRMSFVGCVGVFSFFPRKAKAGGGGPDDFLAGGPEITDHINI